MTLPLQGIKVIDMSQVYFGPGGAVYLADQGAEVIKIETIRGDAMRHRYTSPYLTKWNMSKPFLSLNKHPVSLTVWPGFAVLISVSNFPITRILFSNSVIQKTSFSFPDNSMIVPFSETFRQLTSLKHLSQ